LTIAVKVARNLNQNPEIEARSCVVVTWNHLLIVPWLESALPCREVANRIIQTDFVSLRVLKLEGYVNNIARKFTLISNSEPGVSVLPRYPRMSTLAPVINALEFLPQLIQPKPDMISTSPT